MTIGNAPPHRRIWLPATVGVLILAAFVFAAWYLTGPQFQSYVRGRVIADLEDMTGGRVELKSLTWNLPRLEFDVRDLTIHGKESPGEVPYMHADRLLGRARIISLFGRKIGLRHLEIERPIIHLIVYPDGTTNQPTLRVLRAAKIPVERIFDIGVGRVVVNKGELLVNDHPIPLDFNADDVNAAMSYDAPADRFDGTIRIGNVDVKYRDFLPVKSSIDAKFSLWRTAAELKSLRWESGKSVLEASGRIPGFKEPKIDMAYNARLDLRQISAVMRIPTVQGGALELNGQGNFTAADFASAGTLLIRDLDYRGREVRLRNATVGAQYSVTKARLVIPHIFAHVLGGTVVGDAEVRNWTDNSGLPKNLRPSGRPEIGRPLAGAPEEGMAHLRIQNIPVQALAAAVSSSSLPLDRLDLVGSTRGTIDARWRGSLSNVQAGINVEVVPPANTAPSQLPVSAKVQAEYIAATEVVRITDLSLSTRATRLTGSGTLGPGSQNLKLALTTTNLGELQPVLDAFHGPKRLPVQIRGQGTFNGTAIGKLSALTIAGHLQVTDFDTLIETAPYTGAQAVAAAQAAQPATIHRAHWDMLTADVLYSPRMAAARNAVLKSGKAQLNFDGSVGLRGGSVTPSSPISAHLAVRNADLSDLQALAGYQYPVTGTVNATLAISGTNGDPRGGGHIVLNNGRIYDEPITSLATDVVFANREAQANNITLVHNGARVSGTFAYNIDTAAFRFDVRGSNFSLARMPILQTRHLALAGGLNFAARGSGTKEAPVVDASVRLTNVVLNGERVGDFAAEAVTTGADMRITGRSNFENADLRVDGTVRLRGDLPADIKLQFAHLDFDPLIRAFIKGHITGHSSAAGNVAVHGPLRRPRDLDIGGAVDQISAELENIRIQNDGPVRFTMGQETFRFDQLRLTGEDTSVALSGSVQLGGQHRLDVRSEGRVNLRLLQSYTPELVSQGTATFGVNVSGAIWDPQVQGQMQITNGSVSYVDVPNGLSEMNGVLAFNRNRLVVQSLSARTGGGTLNITGFVTYGKTLAFNLTATGRDIRLRYPAGISSVANADLTLTGSLQNATVAGDIKITKFGMTPQFDFGMYVARSKQPLEAPNVNSPLNNLHLDVHISSTPELQVQTSLAKISGDVDLRLRGVATRPVVLGKVNIVEGDVFFNGTKYHMERGDVTFSNPVRIEPVLDIEATARVKEYDVTLGFHGPLDRLATTYRSDPPLPTPDIIALLALGHTREETAVQQQPQQNFTEAASYALLGQALNAAVSSRVQRIFGVSRIRIDPQATSESGTTQSGPQLSVEQQVNNNITLTYVTNLSQGNQQTIQLQYDINRNVSIIAIRDDLTGVISFDVKVRQRKK